MQHRCDWENVAEIFCCPALPPVMRCSSNSITCPCRTGGDSGPALPHSHPLEVTDLAEALAQAAQPGAQGVGVAVQLAGNLDGAVAFQAQFNETLLVLAKLLEQVL